MDAISYKLPVFEGPLDLLLFLVQKNKLNIYDIPIADVLRQYMDAIRAWQAADLEVASEFLDMAARLVYIKSHMLLPKHEEAEQLKRELTGRLVEYQLCRMAAQRMAGRYIGADLFLRAPVVLPADHTYRHWHLPQAATEAYMAAVGRGRRRLPPPVQAFRQLVSHTVISVSSKIFFVLRKLYKRDRMTYDAFFEAAHSKSELVATFLAMLELMKAKRITVDDGNAWVSLRGRKDAE